MKKRYVKPIIETIDYAQRDSIASCGAWLLSNTGAGCNSISFTVDGMIECDPSYPYNK